MSPLPSEKSSSRRARRPPTLVPTKGIVVAKAMGVTGLALAELMQYKARQWHGRSLLLLLLSLISLHRFFCTMQ